ncbi:MAG: transposase domain-containing protein [Glaciimonas sp.]|nr:transposase domain-containing protein [Glaciimonas sp.]
MSYSARTQISCQHRGLLQHGTGLYPEAAYEDVFAALMQQASRATSSTVNKASITEARAKIGYAALRDLQAQCCLALAVATPRELLCSLTSGGDGRQQF